MDRKYVWLGEVAKRLGISPLPESWANIDAWLPVIEKIQGDGSNVILKWDGGRTLSSEFAHGACTVVISGGGLQSQFIRRDADLITDALSWALIEYAQLRHGWKQGADC